VEKEYNGEYVYYYDTGPMIKGNYTIFWDLQETLVSPKTSVVQILRVAPVQFWHYAVDLRMLIDKLQKRAGTKQAYTDADVYKYILAGLEIINFINPTTTWSLEDIPQEGSRGVRQAIMYAAAVDAMISQQVMEIELNFSFGGQTVTLDYNHDYGGVLTALQTWLDKFAESKTQIYRLAEGVGGVGVRPYNNRLSKRVFRGYGRDAAFSQDSSLYSSIGL
jgi:hypothetical protein